MVCKTHSYADGGKVIRNHLPDGTVSATRNTTVGQDVADIARGTPKAAKQLVKAGVDWVKEKMKPETYNPTDTQYERYTK